MLVTCALLLVFSKTYEIIENVNPEDVVSPIIPVSLAVLSTIILCTRTVLVKYFTEKFDMDSFSYTAASYFLGGFIFTIVSVVNFIKYGESAIFIVK